MTIQRFENGARFCRVLSHNGTVYLAGMTADDLSGDVAGQTRDTLAKIEHYLGMAGSDKAKLLIGGSCIIAPTGEIAALAVSIDDEVVVHRADLDLIDICKRVNFDFGRYRRPSQYGLIAERAGPLWQGKES